MEPKASWFTEDQNPFYKEAHKLDDVINQLSRIGNAHKQLGNFRKGKEFFWMANLLHDAKCGLEKLYSEQLSEMHSMAQQGAANMLKLALALGDSKEDDSNKEKC